MKQLLLIVLPFLLGTGICAQSSAESSKKIEESPFSYNGWTSSSFWGGGYVQNLILCPSNPNRCYAYIDMAGVYRSDDRGKNWIMLHGALPSEAGLEIRGLSVDPRNADKLVLVIAPPNQFSAGRIYLSNDGGKSFRETVKFSMDNRTRRRATGTIIDRNPKNPDELIIAGYDGVIQSTDNGQTWNYIFKHHLNPTDLHFDRRNTNRIWLASPQHHSFFVPRPKMDYDAGFYISEDSGKTWEKISQDSPTEITQSQSEPYEIYGIFDFKELRRSFDGGKTWESCSKGLATEAVPYHDVWCNKNIYSAISSGKDFILLGSTLKDFYRLDKGSDTWNKIEIESINPGNYLGAQKINDHAFKATSSIIVDPADQTHWYATDYYNVMQSFDSGKTWTCTSDGMSQVVIQNVFSLPGTHDFIVVLMDHSWFITKDAGKTFQPYGGFGYERMYMHSSPADSQVIYTSGPRASVVTVSKDGGKTWKMPQQKGLPENRQYFIRASIAPDAKDAATIYLGVSQEFADGKGGGVYISHDAGETWTRMSNGLPDPNEFKGKGFFENTNVCGNELTVSKEGTPIAISIVYNYVCRWNKDKSSWETVRQDSRRPWGLKDIQTDPFSSRIWLAAADCGLLFSDDDGKTWSNLESFSDHAGRISFDRNQPGRFTVMSREGAYLTEDNGQNWYFYDFDLKVPGRGLNSIMAIDGENLLMGTPNSGVFYHRIERNADKSPKGFIKKQPEKKIYHLNQIKDFFGTGKLYLESDISYTVQEGKHAALFGIRDNSTIKVICENAENYATVSTAPLSVQSGKKYRVNFEAKGNVKLNGYLSDPERQDFISAYQLTSEWKNFSVTVIPRSSRMSMALLNWKQEGFFEIRNLDIFQVEE